MKVSRHPDEVAGGLFEDMPAVQPHQALAAQQARRRAAQCQGEPRLLQPNRRQIELQASDLESLLGEDHLARLVWGYVERQDLSRLSEAIKARGSNAGRSAIEPRILFALWLYATLDGVGSGREIARLTRESDAYRWICGGVSVNYHALNDFRSGNEALMDEVLTTNVAALAMLGRRNNRKKRATVGADKGYDSRAFIKGCRKLNVTPHVAAKDKHSAVDGRIKRHDGYKIDLKVGFSLEEAFGWIKTVGGLAKNTANLMTLFALSNLWMVRKRLLKMVVQG